jgi:hypothetical protein
MNKKNSIMNTVENLQHKTKIKEDIVVIKNFYRATQFAKNYGSNGQELKKRYFLVK